MDVNEFRDARALLMLLRMAFPEGWLCESCGVHHVRSEVRLEFFGEMGVKVLCVRTGDELGRLSPVADDVVD